MLTSGRLIVKQGSLSDRWKCWTDQVGSIWPDGWRDATYNNNGEKLRRKRGVNLCKVTIGNCIRQKDRKRERKKDRKKDRKKESKKESKTERKKERQNERKQDRMKERETERREEGKRQR